MFIHLLTTIAILITLLTFGTPTITQAVEERLLIARYNDTREAALFTVDLRGQSYVLYNQRFTLGGLYISPNHRKLCLRDLNGNLYVGDTNGNLNLIHAFDGTANRDYWTVWGWLDDATLVISQRVNATTEFSVINDKGHILSNHHLSTMLNNFWQSNMLDRDQYEVINPNFSDTLFAVFNNGFDHAVVPLDATIYHDTSFPNPFEDDVLIGGLVSFGEDETLRIHEAFPWWGPYSTLKSESKAIWSRQGNLVAFGVFDGNPCGHGVYVFDTSSDRKFSESRKLKQA